MKENVQMSIKEAERLGVMRQIDKKKLTLNLASEELGISLRQTKRVRKRYLKEGEMGLISQKRGKESNRKTRPEIKNRILDLLLTKYVGFGPILAVEKLEELEGLKFSPETIRQWQIEVAYGNRKEKKKFESIKEEKEEVDLEVFCEETDPRTTGLKNEVKNAHYCSLLMTQQGKPQQQNSLQQKRPRATLNYSKNTWKNMADP